MYYLCSSVLDVSLVPQARDVSVVKIAFMFTVKILPGKYAAHFLRDTGLDYKLEERGHHSLIGEYH